MQNIPEMPPTNQTVREFINLETGESITLLETDSKGKGRKQTGPEKRSREPFVLLFGTKALQHTSTVLSDKLFWHLVGEMKYDELDQTYFTADLARQFETSPDLVTRGLQKLERTGKIFRLKRFHLAVNPAIVWLGTPAGRDKAITTLTEMGKL